MLIFQKSIKTNDLSFYLKKTVREKNQFKASRKKKILKIIRMKN